MSTCYYQEVKYHVGEGHGTQPRQHWLLVNSKTESEEKEDKLMTELAL